MRNTGLEETQAGIKIARRNISNLRYADDTTLMAESEEELKSLLMKVKEESTLGPLHEKSWLIGKDPDAGRDWGQEENGMTEDKMVGWHHQLNGNGFGWVPAIGDGQGGLAYCSSWGRKGLDTTEHLNWTELFCFISVCKILKEESILSIHLLFFLCIKVHVQMYFVMSLWERSIPYYDYLQEQLPSSFYAFRLEDHALLHKSFPN